MISEYNKFIEAKKHNSINHGIEVNFIPDDMFDFQSHVSKYAINKGRAAVFLDTGLGKTIIELTIAKNYRKTTGKPVLIITPLAVAFQFIAEASKFGIDSIQYSKDGRYDSDIVVCNYERLNHFNSSDFDCVILDESSILKNFDGATKEAITSFLKQVKYRFLFTATPSPNDFIELGTSSEALGYLGYMDMLSKFFKNNEDTISPNSIGTKWRLKGHAKDDFFRWVSGWSISMRKPSDLGYSDHRHVMPELVLNSHLVDNDNMFMTGNQIELLPVNARRLQDVNGENKRTIAKRCEKAIELASDHETSVYWCNYNEEGDLLARMDKDSIQIKGSMSIDKKEDILTAFSKGDIKKLVTKAKMTAFGLNWQHCNHTVYFPTFSYEQYYQAIRRFWRFGQKNDVFVDLVFAEGQARVLDSLVAKSAKASELFSKLNANVNKRFDPKSKGFDKEIQLPTFIKKGATND